MRVLAKISTVKAVSYIGYDNRSLYELIFEETYDESKAEEIVETAKQVEKLYEADSEALSQEGVIHRKAMDYILWLMNTKGFKDVWQRKYRASTVGVAKQFHRLSTEKIIAALSHHPTSGVMVELKDPTRRFKVNETYAVHGIVKPSIGPLRTAEAIPIYYSFIGIEAESYEKIFWIDRFVAPTRLFKSPDFETEPATQGEILIQFQPPPFHEDLHQVPDIIKYAIYDPVVNPAYNPLYRAAKLHSEEIDWNRSFTEILEQLIDFALEDLPDFPDYILHVYVEEIFTPDWRGSFEASFQTTLSGKISVEVVEGDPPSLLESYGEASDKDAFLVAASIDPNIMYRVVHLLEPGSQTYYNLYDAVMIGYANLSEYPMFWVSSVKAEQPQFVSEIKSPLRYLWDSGVVVIDQNIGVENPELLGKVVAVKTLGMVAMCVSGRKPHRMPAIPISLEVKP